MRSSDSFTSFWRGYLRLKDKLHMILGRVKKKKNIKETISWMLRAWFLEENVG